MNSVSPGDTINIEAGTYVGFDVPSANIGTSSDWITIQGAPGTTRDQVIIAKKGPNNTHQCGVQFGDAYGGTGQNSPYYWIVQGLSVIPADSTQFVNEGISAMASYVTINNCVIDGAGYTMDGGLLSAGNYVTVQNSTVARTVGTGLIGHGIYLGGGGSTSANTTQAAKYFTL